MPEQPEDEVEDDLEVGTGAAPEEKIALTHRVRLLERDVRGHSRSITKLTEYSRILGSRTGGLEEWQMERRLAEVREEERSKALNERLERMEKSFNEGLSELGATINEIKSFGSKVFWIVMGTVIPALVLGVGLVIVFGGQIVNKLG
jgi:phage-related protein